MYRLLNARCFLGAINLIIISTNFPKEMALDLSIPGKVEGRS